MKNNKSLLLIVIIVATLLFSACGQKQSGDLLGWQWAEGQMDTALKLFQAKFPEVNVVVETIPQADYDLKVRTSVASGTDVADLLMTDINTRGLQFTLDVFDDLEAAPYKLDRKQIFESLWPILSNAEGKLVAIDCTLCPAGYGYKLSLAEKYLGTSDPEAIEKMIPDWDSFIAVGKDVVAKSGGTVFMLPGSGDLYWPLKGQNPMSLVTGNEVDTALAESLLATTIKVRDAGVIDKLDMGSPGWSTAYGLENHIFWLVPTWGVKYWLNALDTNAAGKWGIIVPPGGACSVGGAAASIYKGSTNKGAAWEYMKIWLMSKEGAVALKDGIGYYTSWKKAYDDKNFITWKDAAFPNQDLGEFFFKKIVPSMKIAPINQYDGPVMGAFSTGYNNLFTEPTTTLAEAMEAFKADIAASDPNLTLK